MSIGSPSPTPASLWSALDEASTSAITLQFPDEGLSEGFSTIWEKSQGIARLLQNRLDAGIGVLLSTTPDALACFLGALQVGCPVASLPNPSLPIDLGEYVRFVQQAIATVHLGLMLVDDEVAGLIPRTLGVELRTFREIAQHAEGIAGLQHPLAGAFVQYTSGSTSAAQGVALSQQALLANIDAIHNVLAPQPGDNAISWLPWSHDMGLVGMVLAAIIGAGPRHSDGATLAYLRPLSFVRRPARWLEAIEQFRGTITAGPTFAYDLVSRPSTPVPRVDLSSLRVALVGAEIIHAPPLEAFATRFGPQGLRSTALTPAYGLAEFGVCVSMEDPAAESLKYHASNHAQSGAITGRDVLSSGLPLRGYDVRTEIAGRLGRLVVDGPSLGYEYVGRRELKAPFVSEDLGLVVDGRVFVLARQDDLVKVRGRFVSLVDIDLAVAGVPGVRAGRAAAVFSPEIGLVVAAESEGESSSSSLSRHIGAEVLRVAGLRPTRVLMVERGGLPRTSSGKIRRSALVEAILASTLPITT